MLEPLIKIVFTFEEALLRPLKTFKFFIAILAIFTLEIQPAFLFAAPLVYKDVERRMENKEFDNAEKLLGIYLSLNDKDVTALSMRGRLYQEAGDKVFYLGYPATLFSYYKRVIIDRRYLCLAICNGI